MLAVVDPPAGDPWIAFMVQQELYTEYEAQILLDCFINLIDAFTNDIQLAVLAPQMFNEVAVQKAIELGKGKSRYNSLEGTSCYACSLRLPKQVDHQS